MIPDDFHAIVWWVQVVFLYALQKLIFHCQPQLLSEYECQCCQHKLEHEQEDDQSEILERNE